MTLLPECDKDTKNPQGSNLLLESWMANLRLGPQVRQFALHVFHRWETTSSVTLGASLVEDGTPEHFLHGILQCPEDRDERINK